MKHDQRLPTGTRSSGPFSTTTPSEAVARRGAPNSSKPHQTCPDAGNTAPVAVDLAVSHHPSMPAIRTNAAAAMLGVSPNTLRSWERRFGFPEPRRTAGGHRQFELAEVEALRSAFEETHNVSSAISIARERGAGPATPARLKSAFMRFDDGDADRIVEESLTVRSMERTVEEVILPSVLALEEDGVGGETPEWLRMAVERWLARRPAACRTPRQPS